MRRALVLARRAGRRTRPNPMVGAVVVARDRVVGEGYHRMPGGPHAEVEALEAAGSAAEGATLYVSLEPCNHQGRTPPCTDRILRAGIARVEAAIPDPNPRVSGGGAERLRSAGVPCRFGLCAREAEELNAPFLTWSRLGRPRITLKIAQTLDGRIARRRGAPTRITGPEAQARVHRLRSASDGVLIGVGTLLADDPRLTARGRSRRLRAQPRAVILDRGLRTPPGAAALTGAAGGPPLVLCGPGAPEEAQQALTAAGAEIVRLAETMSTAFLEVGMRRLGDLGIQELLVEGGARIFGAFLRSGLADRLLVHLAPRFLGHRAVPSAELPAGAAPGFVLETLRRLGGDLELELRPEREG